MIRIWKSLLYVAITIVIVSIAPRISFGQATTDEQARVDRYEKILRSRPQFGTAFDKLYEYYQRLNKLDDYSAQLKQEAEQSKDANTIRLLGLMQLRRGMNDQAVETLTWAKDTSPADPSLLLHLSQALIQSKQYDRALQTARQTVELKPTQAVALDLVNVIAALGRHVDQDAVVELFESLANQFPAAQPILEKVTVSVAELNPARARPLYSKLISITRDPQRRLELQAEQARILKQLGESEKALAELEKLSTQVKPGSWLHTTLSKEIEELTEQQLGADGLIERYQKAIAKQPSNVDAHLRLAQLLNRVGRQEEAKQLLTKAHQLAPTQEPPLLALADLLEQSQSFSETTNVMQQLMKLAPTNTDYIQRCGQLVMKDQSKPLDRRQEEATTIWNKLIVGHEKDATRLAQVAQLFIDSENSAPAISYLNDAIKNAEDPTGHREQLCTYLHRLGRTAEARNVLTDAIQAPAAERVNLVQLSDLASRLGFSEDAIAALQRACEMQPQFAERMKLAKSLADAGRNADSLAQLEQAGAEAVRAQEWNALWDLQVALLKKTPPIDSKLKNAEEQVRAQASDPVGWRNLALLYSATSKPKQAAEAAHQATQVEPQSLSAWLLAARMDREANMAFREIDSLNLLTQLDAQNKIDYLQRLATIQFQQAQIDDALKTVDTIINSSGASLQNYQMAWNFCLQAKQPDRALAYLRRASLAFPKDRNVWISLARHASESSKSTERDSATEALWNALELSKDAADQREAFDLLWTHVQGTENLQAFIDQIEQFGRSKDRANDADLWTAWALQSSDQLDAPKSFFERLTKRSRIDPQLLEAGVQLAIKQQKLSIALDLQQKLCDQFPTARNQLRLGELQAMGGNFPKAQETWSRIMSTPQNKSQCVAFVKELAASGQTRSVTEFVDVAVKSSLSDWEILSLGISAFLEQGSFDRAAEVAEQLLALNLKHELRSFPDNIAVNQDQASTDSPPPTTAVDRLAWLEHAGAWQSQLNEVNVTRSSYRSNRSNPRSSQAAAVRQLALQRGAALRSTSKQTATLQCFGDARALAVLTKHGKANIRRTGDSSDWKRYLDSSITSKNVDQLWDCVLILEPQRSRTMILNSDGTIDKRSDSEVDRYTEVLNTLISLDQTAALELAISDVVTRRHLQYQLAGRINLSTPLMATDELERLRMLIDQCSEGGLQIPLLWKLTLAMELTRRDVKSTADQTRDGHEVLRQSLASSSDVSELATSANQLHALGRDARSVMSEVLLRGFELQLKNSSPNNDFLTALRNFLTSQDSIDGSAATLLQSMIETQATFVASLPTSEISIDSRFNIPRRSYRNIAPGKSIAALPDHSTLCSTELWQAIVNANTISAVDLSSLLEQKTSLDRADELQERAVRAVAWLCLSALQSSRDDITNAAVSLQNATKQNVAPEIIALQQARLLMSNGQPREAAEVLAEVASQNDMVTREVELWKLELAMRDGNEAEAMRAAEVLARLPLSMQDNAEVASVLNKSRVLNKKRSN